MKKMIVCKGLPASGKSSWAKELLQKEPGKWKRVNKDDFRNMIDNGVWSEDNEEFVKQIHNHTILTALRSGYNVIVDNTHLVPQVIKKLHRLAESVGDVMVIEKTFPIEIEVAKQRNALRIGNAKVPEHVIDKMARSAGLDKDWKKLSEFERYYPPLVQQTIIQNEALPKAIIVDLDGTIALMGNRDPYDASRCDLDAPHIPVLETVLALYNKGYEIIFVSGREDKYIEPTKIFLAEHLPFIPYDLHMRKSGDSRRDSIIKNEIYVEHILDKFNVLLILDDRSAVVSFWRSIGLSCFQVQYGDF